MISDIENIDLMIGEDHYVGGDFKFGDFARRPESPNYETLVDHNSNSDSTSRENKIRRLAENGRLTSEISSDSNLNHQSGEITRRI